jgi:hypothetical protein
MHTLRDHPSAWQEREFLNDEMVPSTTAVARAVVAFCTATRTPPDDEAVVVVVVVVVVPLRADAWLSPLEDSGTAKGDAGEAAEAAVGATPDLLGGAPAVVLSGLVFRDSDSESASLPAALGVAWEWD